MSKVDTNYRIEKDTMGEVHVPADKLWGPQTQRSLENFKIGNTLMPYEVIQALALIKECAAETCLHFKLISKEKSDAIVQASHLVQSGELQAHFPLSVWQTGSGTQTNMNVNEVIANKASLLLGARLGQKKVHPNDDVNKCQSSNDTMPAAMRIAGYRMLQQELLPACQLFEKVLSEKVQACKSVVKLGRTHLMDAVPLTLGQEFKTFQDQVSFARERITKQLPTLLKLPLGGTAIGTGLNTPSGFSSKICKILARKTKLDFESAEHKFTHIAAHDPLVHVSGSLKGLAVTLMKIANDIRLLASGPRAGLSELILPANEPGSSIMPGKVNPTQCEALSMVCAEIIGKDASLTYGASQGHLQLNAYKPLIIYNLLNMIRLLTDGLNNFREKCLQGLKPNKANIKRHVDRSLMLVTALNPHIGYERAAQLAKQAWENNTSLKEELVASGWLSEEEISKILQPASMTEPNIK